MLLFILDQVWNVGLDEMIWILRLWDELFEGLRDQIYEEEEEEEAREEEETYQRNLEVSFRGIREGMPALCQPATLPSLIL